MGNLRVILPFYIVPVIFKVSFSCHNFLDIISTPMYVLKNHPRYHDSTDHDGSNEPLKVNTQGASDLDASSVSV